MGPRELLVKLDANEDREGTLKFQYSYGVLAQSAFFDFIAYGRYLGLNIQIHRGGGLLVRRGFIVAMGNGALLHRFLLAFVQLVERSK